MERTQHPNVYLDLSHLDPAMVRQRFPGIAKVCQGFGLDISRDLIPVRPGAHYMVARVTVDRPRPDDAPQPLAGRRSDFSDCMAPTGSPPTACSRAWYSGRSCGLALPEAAGKMPDTFTIPPLSFRIEFPSQEALDART